MKIERVFCITRSEVQLLWRKKNEYLHVYVYLYIYGAIGNYLVTRETMTIRVQKFIRGGTLNEVNVIIT